MKRKKIERCLGVIVFVIAMSFASNTTELSTDSTISKVSVSEMEPLDLYAGVTEIEVTAATQDTVIVEPEEMNEEMSSYDSDQTNTDTEEEEESVSYMYPNCYKVNIRNTPSTDSADSIIETVTYETQLEIIGEPDENGWVKVNLNGNTAYVLYSLLTNEMIEIEDAYVYDGIKLTSTNGHVEGPSGRETYYNMDMSFCVARMHRRGYEGEYWVREDGVKMFGDYVMVAANFAIRPLGTILPTSLGMAIVVDTGGFANTHPYGLDVAVAW